MRNLIKLIIIAVIGLISYNYFYGNEVEKARSEKIVGEVKDVFVSVKDLVKMEKEKFEEGKYDKAMDKISNLFKDFKDKSQEVSVDLKERFSQLEQEKIELEERIDQKKKEGTWTKEEKEKTKEDFQKLIQKTEELFKEVAE